MKVVLVTTEISTPSAPSGGLGNSVVRLARALRDFGHPTRLLAPATPGARPSTTDDVMTYAHDPPSSLRLLDRWTMRRFNLGLTAIARARTVARVVGRLAGDERPDLVHYSNLGGVARFHPAPIASTVRISSDTELCWRVGGYDNQSRLAIRQQIALERAAMRRADAVYAPSATTARTVARSIQRPVEVFPTPFFIENVDQDPDLYRQRLNGLKYVLFVGLLNRLKGVTDLAAVLPRLLARHRDVHVVFVGREHTGFGSTTMQEHVLRQAGDTSSRILFLGELSHASLFPVIQGAHFLTLPSRAENLPNVCLEAMALGRVVVGTRETAFEELLSDGQTGFLCRPADPVSLEETIEAVLSRSEEDLRTIGQRASAAAGGYAPEYTIPPLAAFFERVISRRRAIPATEVGSDVRH